MKLTCPFCGIAGDIAAQSLSKPLRLSSVRNPLSSRNCPRLSVPPLTTPFVGSVATREEERLRRCSALEPLESRVVLSSGDILVCNSGTIGEYMTSGATVDASFI